MVKVNIYTTKRSPCELHACLRHAMQLCLWAGYLPVQGLNKLSINELKFNIKSIYSIYHFMTITGQTAMCCFSLIYFFYTDITLNSISNAIFYVTGFIVSIRFIKLAQQWPKLMKKAQETEQSINKLSKSPARKSRFIAYTIMSLALVEHILCTNFYFKFVISCLHETSITHNVMENYVKYRMPYVFKYVSYNIFNTLLTEFLCMQATFLWSFSDVMIICFSIYITSYLQNLNEMIYTKKKGSVISWGVLREYHSKIAVLVKEIDDHLSLFVLFSFFVDLFFICLQLFNSLHRNHCHFEICNAIEIRNVLSSTDYLLYYLYSFSFLLVRTLSLSLFTANVHVAGQEPVIAVYDIPSSQYDAEIQRFQLQLRFTKIALTGKFFTVTRNMVLQVIGTIITYELVLLQFSVAPAKNTLSISIAGNSTSIE